MPNNIIYEYENAEGEIIRIEAESSQRGNTRGRGGNDDSTVKRVRMKFEEALGTVKSAAAGMKTIIDQVNPDEATVEFSIKAEGEAGFFTICRAATGAEFKITLKWGGKK